MYKLFVLALGLIGTRACSVSVNDAWNCIQRRIGKSSITEQDILVNLLPGAGFVQKRILHSIVMSCDADNDGIVTLQDVEESQCATSCKYRLVIQKQLC
jgi:hypothetical protein